MPAGVVNLLAGGGEVGARIVADERSTASRSRARSRPGRRSRACARTGSRGSTWSWAARTRSSSARTSPARIDVAARGGAWAAYLNAGQVCTSAERFYVMKPVYDDFLQAFVDHTRNARRGRSDGPGDRHRAARVGATSGRACSAQVEGAVAAGATLVRGAEAGRPRPLLHAGDRDGSARARRTCCARRHSGRWPRSCRWRRSTRRSSWRTRRASGSARTSTRATSRPWCAACGR